MLLCLPHCKLYAQKTESISEFPKDATERRDRQEKCSTEKDEAKPTQHQEGLDKF